MINHDKIYEAEIKLGVKTDTLDREGKILEQKEVGTIEEKRVREVLQKFIGKQEQIPPIYSAIKVNGKKLYEYARQRQEVEIKPRKIEVYAIKLQEIDYEENIIKIKVHSSKGTYIRTLCNDISEALGTVGHMYNLNRVKVRRIFDRRFYNNR